MNNAQKTMQHDALYFIFNSINMHSYVRKKILLEQGDILPNKNRKNTKALYLQGKD